MFSQSFSCSDLLVANLVLLMVFEYGAITLYRRTFQTVPLTNKIKIAGWSPFARRY